MKKLGFFLLALGMTAAQAKDIYTGSEKGAYFRFYGPAINDVIKGAMFNDYQVVKTGGTGDNLKRLAETPSAIALAQMDVANDLITKTSGWSDKMVVVRADLGHECLFAVTSNPKLTSWGQVQQFATRMRVATASKESGSYLTLQNLQAQDSTLKGLDANLQNASDALSAIKLVKEKKADLAFFVQVADVTNPIFEEINKGGMSFVPVADRSFLRLEINGQKVYDVESVKVTPANFMALSGAKSVNTTCTKVALVTGKPEALPEGAARTDQKDLIKALSEAPVDKIRPNEPALRKAIDNTAALAEGAINSLWEQAKNVRSQF